MSVSQYGKNKLKSGKIAEMKIIWKLFEIGNTRFEANITIYSKNDKRLLKSLYFSWLKLNKAIRDISTRGINIPEAITENIFCMVMPDCVRVVKLKKGKCSFDAVNTKTGSRIQIKASSVDEDLTSFGPRSEWDQLYFMDFSRGDGTFDIYEVEKSIIYSHKVNSGQTLEDQRKLGRRPRFSIKKELIARGVKPVVSTSFD